MNQRDRAERITELFEKYNEEPTAEEELQELADQLEKKGWDTQAQQLREESGDTDYEQQVSEFHAKLDQWDVSEFSDERRLTIVRSLWGMFKNSGDYAKEKAKRKLIDMGFRNEDNEILDRQKILQFVA